MQQLPATVTVPPAAVQPPAATEEPSAVHQQIEQPEEIGTKALQTAQAVRSMDCALHCEPEDNISDALSVTNGLADQDDHVVSSGSVRSDHQQARQDMQEEGNNAQWSTPHELLSLYSPPRSPQTQYGSIPGWNGLFDGGAPNFSNMPNPEKRGYDLPPLPPSLESMLWEWPVLQQRVSTLGWSKPAQCETPCWLPGGALGLFHAPHAQLSWATGPEVVFGPGVANCSFQITCPHIQSEAEVHARRALAEANLSGTGLVNAITQRVASLQIDDQRAFISKIASLLSASILPTPLQATSARHKLKKKMMGAVKAPRQSARLSPMQSNFSSSRRSRAAICVQLGFIKREADFNDSTLLAYLNFFREPMPMENVANLVHIAGLSSPSQLHLPEAELQAILDELPVRAV
ncbi:hypothetical protein ZWY2020_036024 [Hordeum vulgare]|nr:hypothetical protein ZWY2020_036024 [Hordeum vulgare]